MYYKQRQVSLCIIKVYCVAQLLDRKKQTP